MSIQGVLADRVCELLANGYSLRQIARMPGMPRAQTIVRTVNVDPGFAEQYRRARAQAGHFYADRSIEIAGRVLDGKLDPNAARVAIAAYQWAASKLNPRDYGDHQQVDVNLMVSDSTEHAPEWMKRRLAGPGVIEVQTERIPANTPGGLLADISSAAAGEVEPEPQQ